MKTTMETVIAKDEAAATELKKDVAKKKIDQMQEGIKAVEKKIVASKEEATKAEVKVKSAR